MSEYELEEDKVLDKLDRVTVTKREVELVRRNKYINTQRFIQAV